MKRIFQIQKKTQEGSWTAVSQCYCEETDVRKLIHSVSTDERTRVVAAGPLDKSLPLYNFVPPGVMTKIND